MKFEIVKDNQMVSLQTSDGPFGPSVGGLYNHIWPPLLIKPYNRALGAKGKQKIAAFGSSPPLVPYGTTFPPQAQCYCVKKNSESTRHYDVCFFLYSFFSC